MNEAVCGCCRQSWLRMPGECETSICPACQVRNERDRKAAEKAKRQELRDANRFGVTTENGKNTVRRHRR